MRTYTTHLEHVTGGSVSVCGDAHAKQSFMGEFLGHTEEDHSIHTCEG